MTLSVPLAQNVPAVSLGALLDPKRPNTAKTSLFQNVLDALQLPDENMSDSSQQQPNQQPVSIQKAGSPVAQESSITAQQQLSQQHGSPQLSTIAFLPVHLYAAPTAAPLLEQVAQVGSLQQGESSEQEFGPSSVRGEASKRTLDQQPHVPEISDSDKRETSAPVVNSVPTRLTLAASAPEPASMQALSLAPAPSQQAVIPAPVKEDPAVQPQAQQITHSSQSASPTAPLQSAKSSVPAESSRSQSTATATAAANVEPIATNAGGSITKETARAISITPASEPIANPKSEPAAEMANHSRVRNPEPFDSSVLAAKPAAPELTEPIAAAKDSPIGTNASEPAKSNKESGPVAPPPGSDHAGTSLITAAAAPQASQNVRHAGQISPKELLRKTAAVQTHASQKTSAPERIPAYWQASPTTTQPPPTPHAQQYPVPPSSEPGVPVQTITPPALPSVPSGPTASPTETQPATPLRQSARKSDSPVSRQVRTVTEEKKSVQDAIVPASPITNANTADLLVQPLTQPAPLAPARKPSTATAPSSEVSPREPTISSRIEREPLAAPVAASTAPKSPITPEAGECGF